MEKAAVAVSGLADYTVPVDVEFDPEKDVSNFAKHGLALTRATEMDVLIRVADTRYTEPRFRAYGLIAGKPHCLAYVMRGRVVRAISLRRCHQEEFDRYVRPPQAQR